MIIISIIWSCILIISLTWNIITTKNHTRLLAKNKAQASFNKDQAFRFWATKHGGVYVPITKTTPPNKNLKNIAERDIETKSGKKLTLMNPAYMIRQLMSMYPEKYGIKGKITSLKVLWPGNKPDKWEKKVLTMFSKTSIREFSEFTLCDGRQCLRYMKAMTAQKNCLKCHGYQGYKIGDIRGGVGVLVDLSPFVTLEEETIKNLSITHSIIWILGLLGLSLSYKKLSLLNREKEDAEIALYLKDRAISSTISAIAISDLKGNITYVNKSFLNLWGYRSSNEVIGKNASTFWVDEKKALDIMKIISQQRWWIGELDARKKNNTTFQAYLVANTIKDENGNPINMMASFLDVTDQKEIEKNLIENELLLRSITENLPDIYLSVIEKDYTIGFSSGGEFTRLKLNPDSYIGLHISEVFDEHLDTVKEKYEETFKGNETSFELYINNQYQFYKTVPLFANDGKVYKILSVVENITERKVAEQELNKSLKEKEIMLKEIHHRVKNNMQVISSLLNLQMSYIDDEDSKSIFVDSCSRIQSMALIHEKLYQSNNLASINIDEFIEDFLSKIKQTYEDENNKLQFDLSINSFTIGIDIAIPIALIMNEVISNSIKHAWNDETSEHIISLKISKEDDDQVTILISDNGIGIDINHLSEKSETLGMQLINSLTTQINGTIEYYSDNGTHFNLSFQYKD